MLRCLCAEATTMFMLLLLWIFLSEASSISSFNFSFPTFNPESCNNGSLICMGSVNGGEECLQLTQPFNSSSPPPSNQVGRVLFHQPVPAWPALITTTFTVRISLFPNSTNAGDGLAFIMAQDDHPSPPDSYGSYLGIMDKSTEGGVVRQIAVELDSYANEFDPDGNHVAIETISMLNPLEALSLNATGIDLKSGKDIMVRIDYNSLTMQFQVSVAYAGQPLMSFLNHSVDMSATVPQSVYVGFTASTGPYPESHQVLNWAFESIPLPDIKNGYEKDDKIRIILVIVVPIAGLLALAACVFPLARSASRKKKEMIRKADIENRSKIAANVPKIFTYKQLSKATRKFNKENLLGTGGFGSVYKGVISSFPPQTVAVKKISATSQQGEREYLAEICTIGRLRHKNIVQLQGWCHEKQHLLLVYEYMPNGSLDRYIGKIYLDWKTRFKILTGLASALLYLHEECGNPVVHRDIKPNNVMVDADYNAHLGDFGLARLLQNDSSAITTMLAGTPGYLAPEVSYTGKATPESDVYSFGMVVIEVVSGQRSKGILYENSLVEYVWRLHERNAVVEALDRMVQGQYDEEEAKRALVVGLACLHPDPAFRPKIRKVEQIFLNPNEPLMELPESRPRSVYVPLSSSSCSTTTDFGSKEVSSLLHSSMSTEISGCSI